MSEAKGIQGAAQTRLLKRWKRELNLAYKADDLAWTVLAMAQEKARLTNERVQRIETLLSEIIAIGKTIDDGRQ